MGVRVLIADDEEGVVFFLKNALTRQGFEVITAYDGISAKEKVLQEHPDVVLLDLTMPKMDGLQVLKWMRQEANLTTPVIIASGRDQMSDIRSGYDLQADFYLVKPLNAKDIINGINVVLSLRERQKNDTSGQEEQASDKS